MVQAAVTSALAQSHPEVEVVVVDDGSTDLLTQATLERIESAGGARVVRQANQGLSGARNRGIEVATGDYILPLDHDDDMHVDYAAKAAAVLDARPNVGIVYARAERFGASTGEWHLPDFTIGRMLMGNVIYASSMFRRSDWIAVDGYSTELHRGWEDWGLWMKILGLGREVVRLDEILFRYRDTEGSMAKGMSYADRVEAFAQIFASNSAVYADNANEFADQVLGQWEMLAHFKGRYGRVENLISRAGALRRKLRRT